MATKKPITKPDLTKANVISINSHAKFQARLEESEREHFQKRVREFEDGKISFLDLGAEFGVARLIREGIIDLSAVDGGGAN